MPCDSRPRNPQQTIQERMLEADRALKRLEAKLAAYLVKVTIGANGAVAFSGWTDRDGISDVCAYRSLSSSGSSALRMAVARAEAMSGRKIDPRAVAAGVHSHDSGHTWNKGH
jgi:hypothetical protein